MIYYYTLIKQSEGVLWMTKKNILKFYPVKNLYIGKIQALNPRTEEFEVGYCAFTRTKNHQTGKSEFHPVQELGYYHIQEMHLFREYFSEKTFSFAISQTMLDRFMKEENRKMIHDEIPFQERNLHSYFETASQRGMESLAQMQETQKVYTKSI